MKGGDCGVMGREGSPGCGRFDSCHGCFWVFVGLVKVQAEEVQGCDFVYSLD